MRESEDATSVAVIRFRWAGGIYYFTSQIPQLRLVLEGRNAGLHQRSTRCPLGVPNERDLGSVPIASQPVWLGSLVEHPQLTQRPKLRPS